jgi:hypothetical protein
MITKTYTGNSAEATQQVLGPTFLPSEWEGQWNTTRMVSCPSYYTESGSAPQVIAKASSIRDVLEGIFESGQRLRVTWASGQDADARRIVRIGRASEWKFAHDRQDDIVWTVTYEWIGRGRAANKAIDLKNDSALTKNYDAMAKLNDALAKAINDRAVADAKSRAKNKPASRFTLGDLEAFAAGPSRLLNSFVRAGRLVSNQLKRISDLGIKIANLPAQLEGQLVDAATNTIAICNQFNDKISSTSPESMTTQNKVGNLLSVTNYFGSTQGDVNSVTDSSIDLRLAARQRKNSQIDGANNRKDSSGVPDILAIWRARSGDTYASISNRFFGTPDHGYAIAKANSRALPPVQIPGTTSVVRGRAYAVAPPIGATLIIPNLTAIKNIENV